MLMRKRAWACRARWPLGALVGLVALLLPALQGADPGAEDRGAEYPGADDRGQVARELAIFKSWLQEKHPGYGCDEGPAQFRNPTVEAAYGGRRFYYVLTYPRGIRPPFGNALSLVAHVDDGGQVERLDPSDLRTYRRGLRKVSKAAGARQAAAAVLILTLGDPGQRRWPIKEDLVGVKRERGGWVCAYAHDPNHASEVRFDRDGALSAVQCAPPPVP